MPFRRGSIGATLLRTGATAGLGWLLAASATPSLAETVLRVVPQAELKYTDPIWGPAYSTRNHGYLVWDTLFGLDSHLEPQPQMVDTYHVSGDRLEYLFDLRPGLRWHDGAPVTAEDCVASLRRWGRRDGMGQRLLAVTASLEALNQRSFRLVLKEPFTLVLESLGKLTSIVPFMMPRRYAEVDPFQQVPSASIGSGPFRFAQDQWEPGKKVVYLKNPRYRARDGAPSFTAGGKVARVDRVEWIHYPSSAAAFAALRRGEVDVIEDPGFEALAAAKKHSAIRIRRADPLGQQAWLRLNHLQPPFDKLQVRQALLWALQQADYAPALADDPAYFQPCLSVYGCGTPNETTAGTEALQAQDLGSARQLLKEAGYRGERVVLLNPTDRPALSQATQSTARLLRRLGMTVDVQAMDWSTLSVRREERGPLESGGWSLFLTAWALPDVLNPAVNIGLSGGGPALAWYGWPQNEPLEQLRTEWMRSGDPERRLALARDIQVEALANVNYIPLGQFYRPLLYRRQLKGLLSAPVPLYWNVSKE